jgi:hypothetical protein
MAPRPPRAWQRMLSGRRLDLLDPSPLDIEIEDIAHGLARVARWNGQTLGPKSIRSRSIRCWWRRSGAISTRIWARRPSWRSCFMTGRNTSSATSSLP